MIDLRSERFSVTEPERFSVTEQRELALFSVTEQRELALFSKLCAVPDRFSSVERRDRAPKLRVAESVSRSRRAPDRFSTVERRDRKPSCGAAISVTRSRPGPNPRVANTGWLTQAFISSH